MNKLKRFIGDNYETWAAISLTVVCAMGIIGGAMYFIEKLVYIAKAIFGW